MRGAEKVRVFMDAGCGVDELVMVLLCWCKW